MKQKDTNLIRSNVFQATEDSYVSGAILDDEVLYNSPHHKLVKRSNGKYVILDPLAPDFKEIVLDRGEAQAPDEILEAIKPLSLKIPVPGRDDLGPEDLPSSNLLRAIHLYSNQIKMVCNSLDESALLALGMAAELWADELIGNGDPLMFLLAGMEPKLSDFPPEALDYEEIIDEFEDEISSSEDEVIPPQLLESDTDEEILRFKIKRQKLNNTREVELNKDASSSDSSSSESSSDSESSSNSSMYSKSDAESDSKSVLPSVKLNERNKIRTESLYKPQSPNEKLAESPESEVDTSLYEAYEHEAPNLDFYDSEAEDRADQID